MNCNPRLTPALVLGLLLTLTGSHVLADQIVIDRPLCVTGTSTATQVWSPFGEWEYTLTVEWNTGVPQALSHLTLDLGLINCACVCDLEPFGFDSPAGWSNGVDGDEPCEPVHYYGLFQCDGDPSIPGTAGPMLKFEPFEDDCEPGPVGSGQFVYYSDWPPAEVVTPNQIIVLIKYGGESCEGELTGVLPVCTCPTSTRSTSWGDVKKRFR